MIILKPIFLLIDTLLDRLFSLGGALLAAQIPGFLLAYMNVLQGALLESGKLVQSIRMRAGEMGKTMDAFISKHLASHDPDFVASGKIMQEGVHRYDEYQSAYQALQNAPVWEKFFVFLKVMDFNLVKEMHYTPVIPLDTAGLVYGLIGLFFGLILYQVFLKAPFHLRSYKKAKRQLKGAPG